MQHQDLASGRWHTLNLSEQLANIGSEVGRAWQAKEKGLTTRQESALTRALELFDLTLATPNLRLPALHEVARAREILVADFFGGNCYNNSAVKWDKYFFPFVIATRS